MTTTATAGSTMGPTRAQDRTGRTLMAILAAITAVVFVDALRCLTGVDDDLLRTEFWRTFDYVVFGGMWRGAGRLPGRFSWPAASGQRREREVGAAPEGSGAGVLDAPAG